MGYNVGLMVYEAISGKTILTPPIINLAKKKGGKPMTVLKVITTRTPVIKDEVLKIIADCDPIQFLCDIVNGQPLQCWIVAEDKTLIEEFESPTVQQRINAAKFLTNKYLPNAPVRHAHLHKNIEDDPKAPDKRGSYAQIVSLAANAEDGQSTS